MGIFVILFLGVFSLVKCDVGVGYRYQVPVTSYDVPSGSVGNLHNDRKYYHIEKQPFATGNLASVAPSSELETPIHEHANFIDTGNLQQNNLPFSGGVQGITHTRTGYDSSTHKQTISTFNLPASQQEGAVNFQEAALNRNIESSVPSQQNFAINSKSNFESQNSQQVEVQKHLYFYTAPEDPEEVRPRLIVPPARAQKSVKVLFIKAPTYNAAPISIPVLPQNEEKTLVYVLVKRPEESSIVLPTAAPAKPTKPEVYFIKYKSHKEAQDAIENIQQNRGVSNGVSAISASDANSFSNDFAAEHSAGTDQFNGYDQNVNLESKVGDVRAFVPEAPVVISTTASTPSSDSASLHIGGQVNSGPITNLNYAYDRAYTGNEPASFGGPFTNSRNNFDSATTAGSLGVPSVSINKGTQEVKIHQLYGPPSN